MTRVFTEAGEHVPVTVLRLAQCQVVAHRTKDKNGYVALQLGSGPRRSNNMSKADRGYFGKQKVEPKRKLAEFRVTEDSVIPVGAEITADAAATPDNARRGGARPRRQLEFGACSSR